MQCLAAETRVYTCTKRVGFSCCLSLSRIADCMALIPGSSVTVTPVTGGLGLFTTPPGTLAGGEIAGPSSAFPAGPAMTAPLAVSGVAPSPTIYGPGPTTSTSASGGLPATTRGRGLRPQQRSGGLH